MGAREHVGGLEVTDARHRVGRLLEVHHARDRVDDVGEGLALAQRARLAVARDRAVDEVGPHRRERRVVAAEARDDAGHEVLDDHVGHAREIEHDRARLRVRQVERDALLARVDADEVGGLVGAVRLELHEAAAHLVALARALDLDDARAEVGEQARAVRAREHP
ncbi:MAG: hypothetical protein A2W08_00525 [Candidatus Rokubacteria bacterium RBG_16_73_20]|nr:MAG: hypothetical protein A2W08_00525 [Candidatus Rokubacteria bacterium RBG_16_73_20]